MLSAPSALRDLPPHRQHLLLWRFASRESFPEIEARFLQPWCTDMPDRGLLVEKATLGSDGRYHLYWPGNVPKPCGQNHKQNAYSWTDGQNYRIHAPGTWSGDVVPEQVGSHSRTVKWRVSFTDEQMPALDVPTGARCPTVEPWWPSPLTKRTSTGRIRAQLVDAFGAGCNICGVNFGQFLGHDHLTGLIRGQLCRQCNNFIELCTHSQDCPYADYLNAPPAAHLRATHPRHRERLATKANRVRMARLAQVIDPAQCAELCAPPAPLF